MQTFIRVFLFAAFIVSIINKAYSAEPLISYTVQAGINYSSVSGNADKTCKFGYRAGLFLEYGAGKGFLKTGFGLTTKEFCLVNGSQEYSASLMYVEIPLNGGFRLRLNKSVKLVFSGGPYLGYGVKGSWSSTNTKETRDAFTNSVFIKFDYGLNIISGVVYKNVQLDIGGEFGLSNLSQDSFSKHKTQNFYLALGYRF